MSGGKGDKTSSVAIPPWLNDQLQPYLTDTLRKNRTFADKTWANMMPGSAHLFGGANTPTYGNAQNPDVLAALRAANGYNSALPGAGDVNTRANTTGGNGEKDPR